MASIHLILLISENRTFLKGAVRLANSSVSSTRTCCLCRLRSSSLNVYSSLWLAYHRSHLLSSSCTLSVFSTRLLARISKRKKERWSLKSSVKRWGSLFLATSSTENFSCLYSLSNFSSISIFHNLSNFSSKSVFHNFSNFSAKSIFNNLFKSAIITGCGMFST